MTIDYNIAQRLKELRNNEGYSQETVANAIYIKRATYAAYEEGRAEPSVAVLVSLAKLYELETIDQLLGLSEVKEKTKDTILQAYYRADREKRKIIDFILNLGR